METSKNKQPISWYELDPNIQTAGIGFFNNHSNRHPTRGDVPYWILVLLDKGQRTLIANNEEIRISAREFFLLPPNTKQKPLELDEHTACFLHFYADGKKISEPKSVNASKLYIPMYGRLPDNVDCFAHLKYIYEHSMSPYADTDFISIQLHALLSTISMHCQKHLYQVVRDGGFIDLCLNFIREHICQPISSEDYETALELSYHQINQKFKKEFGYTVKQYHQRLRMSHAAQLLQSGISLRQVADECGYDDYYFFIKSFKKMYGVAPNLFRAKQGM